MENKIIDEANYGGRGRKKFCFTLFLRKPSFFFLFWGDASIFKDSQVRISFKYE